jgi:ABC-type oligopeptide transport system ATPase subunit
MSDNKTKSPDAPGSSLLQVDGLKTYFPVKGGVFLRSTETCKAVDGVSFQLSSKETFGLVGESGCGKTTLGKTIVRLVHPTAGRILFEGVDLAPLSSREMKPIRRHLQMVFQDPVESLNARHTVGAILEEPFVIHGLGDAAERRRQVGELLERVGLPRDAVHRYPFEFSGGQRQRIGIA